VERSVPHSRLESYAIIARFVDRTTQQWTVIAAGLDKTATGAAGDCVIRPECMNDLVARVDRKDWTSRNLEAVISTQVVDGKPGPSRVLAIEVW
jgi:hypothetical protein